MHMCVCRHDREQTPHFYPAHLHHLLFCPQVGWTCTRQYRIRVQTRGVEVYHTTSTVCVRKLNAHVLCWLLSSVTGFAGKVRWRIPLGGGGSRRMIQVTVRRYLLEASDIPCPRIAPTRALRPKPHQTHHTTLGTRQLEHQDNLQVFRLRLTTSHGSPM